ncbi:Flagellar P-ring protein precursor [Posidoniimonas polymericola]|uniref:Flagellar P-ring protein n=1 Tax=Posidoniimonas polymericola TaxID=2528002 RepID=A0A5C5YFF9_9BACT|nr:flagellar basal body P-ring protein FlgI [Posidoniimonas polymericola]TWT73533.1 Flagellar P-ring protein precursor [Posidoniimonas polymericola]
MSAKTNFILPIVLLALAPQLALAVGRTELRNICHVKGQEENTLRGLGLVVGLNGTGEAGDLQTMRALSSAMEIMGSPVSTTGRADAESLEELKKIKNAALVYVTATVPAAGSRRGDQLDCFVSAINGKSLKGGRLAFSTLQGPNTQDHRVYALCQGQLVVEDAEQPMVARIHGGCQMQQDVRTEFEKDGYVTLVLDRHHADFNVAQTVGELIQNMYRDNFMQDQVSQDEDLLATLVRVENASNIRVQIPEVYRNDPVTFVAQLMELGVYNVEPEARVVVNPRAKSIVISGDVGIGDVVVTHRNLTIEANPAAIAKFEKIDPDAYSQGGSGSAKLQSLVDAMQDLRVPAGDIIEIIKGIERNGKLHGKLIIE